VEIGISPLPCPFDPERTVMGAVVATNKEPMLVMEYMTRGSLYDLLRDTTVFLDTDEHIMPILQDIAQGVRFLHAASPQVIHGDLKAKNVLIDSSFRAKGRIGL
jgi:serine/threonine protein kinase